MLEQNQSHVVQGKHLQTKQELLCNQVKSNKNDQHNEIEYKNKNQQNVVHDPEIQYDSSLKENKIKQGEVKGSQIGYLLRSKSKIRMYGSKRSIIPYTVILNGDQKQIHDTSFAKHKMQKQNISQIQKQACSTAQKNKRKVFGSRKKIAPSFTVIPQSNRQCLQNSNNTHKNDGYNLQSQLSRPSRFGEQNHELKRSIDEQKNSRQNSRLKMIGKQRKITAQIDVIRNNQQNSQQIRNKVENGKIQKQNFKDIKKQSIDENKQIQFKIKNNIQEELKNGKENDLSSKRNQQKLQKNDQDYFDINKIEQPRKKFLQTNQQKQAYEQASQLPQKQIQYNSSTNNAKQNQQQNSGKKELQTHQYRKTDQFHGQEQEHDSKIKICPEKSQFQQKKKVVKRFGSKKVLAPYVSNIDHFKNKDQQNLNIGDIPKQQINRQMATKKFLDKSEKPLSKFQETLKNSQKQKVEAALQKNKGQQQQIKPTIKVSEETNKKKEDLNIMQTKSQQLIEQKSSLRPYSPNNNFIINSKKSSVILTPTKKIKAHISSIDEKTKQQNKINIDQNKNNNNQSQLVRPVKILTLNKQTKPKIDYIQQNKQDLLKQVYSKGDQRKCQRIQIQNNPLTRKQQKEQKMGQDELLINSRVEQKSQKNVLMQTKEQNLEKQSLQFGSRIQKKPSIIIRSNKNTNAQIDYIEENKDDVKLVSQNRTENNRDKKLDDSSQQKKKSIILSSNKSLNAHFEYIEPTRKDQQNCHQNTRMEEKRKSSIKSQKQQQLQNIKSQIDFILESEQKRVSKKAIGKQNTKQSQNRRNSQNSVKLSSNKSIGAYVQYIKEQVSQAFSKQTQKILQKEGDNKCKDSNSKIFPENKKRDVTKKQEIKQKPVEFAEEDKTENKKQLMLDIGKSLQKQAEQKNNLQNRQQQSVAQNNTDQAKIQSEKKLDEPKYAQLQRQEKKAQFILQDSDKKQQKLANKKDLQKNSIQQQIPSKLILRQNTLQTNPDQKLKQHHWQARQNQLENQRLLQIKQNDQYPLNKNDQKIDPNQILQSKRQEAIKQQYSQEQVENTPKQKYNHLQNSTTPALNRAEQSALENNTEYKQYLSDPKSDTKVDNKKQNLEKKQVQQTNFNLDCKQDIKNSKVDRDYKTSLVEASKLNNSSNTQGVPSKQQNSVDQRSQTQSQKRPDRKLSKQDESKIVVSKLYQKGRQQIKQLNSLNQNHSKIVEIQNSNNGPANRQYQSPQTKVHNNKNNQICNKQNNQNKEPQASKKKEKRDEKNGQKQTKVKQNKQNSHLSSKKQNIQNQIKQKDASQLQFKQRNKKNSSTNSNEVNKDKNFSSTKSLGRRGSHIQLVPLSLHKNQIANGYQQLDKVKSNASNVFESKTTNQMASNLSHRSSITKQDKGSLNALVRVSPRHQNTQKKQGSNNKIQEHGNFKQQKKSMKQLDQQIYQLKVSKQKQKQKLLSEENQKKEQRNIVFNNKNSKSNGNLIKKVGVCKFKQIQGQNKDRQKAKIKININIDEKDSKYSNDDKSEYKSNFSKTNQKFKSYKSEQKSKKAQKIKGKVPSPYLNPAFNNIYKQKQYKYQKVPKKHQNQIENDKMSQQQDNDRENWRSAPNKKIKNTQFNQRQLKKFRDEYQKVKKLQQQQFSRRNSRNRKQRSHNRQANEQLGEIRQRKEQRTKTFKFLKAHSHQFSYLYPSASIQEQDKRLNQRLKQLDKKLKRQTYKIGRKKQHDEVHQFISEARRQIRQSQKYLNNQDF